MLIFETSPTAPNSVFLCAGPDTRARIRKSRLLAGDFTYRGFVMPLRKRTLAFEPRLPDAVPAYIMDRDNNIWVVLETGEAIPLPSGRLEED